MPPPSGRQAVPYPWQLRAVCGHLALSKQRLSNRSGNLASRSCLAGSSAVAPPASTSQLPCWAEGTSAGSYGPLPRRWVLERCTSHPWTTGSSPNSTRRGPAALRRRKLDGPEARGQAPAATRPSSAPTIGIRIIVVSARSTPVGRATWPAVLAAAKSAGPSPCICSHGRQPNHLDAEVGIGGSRPLAPTNR